MNAQELSQSKARTKVLSKVSELDRLLRIMARWWTGWSWEQIALEHGISRQRVGRLLARVGCLRTLWLRADHRRTGESRRVLASQAAQARNALLHRCARRLTPRQRAALAWRAMGLGSVATARRMVTTPTNVRSLIVAARWRLERLSGPKRRKRAGQRMQRGSRDMMQLASDVGIPIDWNRLVDGTNDGRSPVNKRAPATAAQRAAFWPIVPTLPHGANRAVVGRVRGNRYVDNAVTARGRHGRTVRRVRPLIEIAWRGAAPQEFGTRDRRRF